MPDSKFIVDQLEALGYTVGVAYGSSVVEEAALADAMALPSGPTVADTVKFHEAALKESTKMATVYVVSNDEITTYVALNDQTGQGADAASASTLASLLGG